MGQSSDGSCCEITGCPLGSIRLSSLPIRYLVVVPCLWFEIVFFHIIDFPAR